MTNKPRWAIVTAAGSGTRLGAELPKALVSLGGKSLVYRAVQTALQVARIAGVVVSYPDGFEAQFAAELHELRDRTTLVAGGVERSDSVYRALCALQERPDDEVVLVHDAARCLCPAALFAHLAEHVENTGRAAVATLPMVDTVKQVLPGTDQIVATVSRESLRVVQTPQAFPLGQLRAGHDNLRQRGDNGQPITDDADLVERLGLVVDALEGDQRAMKITTPFDFKIAQMLLR